MRGSRKGLKGVGGGELASEDIYKQTSIFNKKNNKIEAPKPTQINLEQCQEEVMGVTLLKYWKEGSSSYAFQKK